MLYDSEKKELRELSDRLREDQVEPDWLLGLSSESV